jgi:hypothetical protein
MVTERTRYIGNTFAPKGLSRGFAAATDSPAGVVIHSSLLFCALRVSLTFQERDNSLRFAAADVELTSEASADQLSVPLVSFRKVSAASAEAEALSPNRLLFFGSMSEEQRERVPTINLPCVRGESPVVSPPLPGLLA